FPAVPAGAFNGPEGFHLSCCLGTLEEAREYADELSRTVPGLETEIEPMALQDAKGGQRTIYNIYVAHPELSPDEICSRLGQGKCPHLQQPCPGPGSGPSRQAGEESTRSSR
ncbi:MAG: hypothetical protein ACOC0U_03420, partial [Desulfovibrionales bacterium]